MARSRPDQLWPCLKAKTFDRFTKFYWLILDGLVADRDEVVGELLNDSGGLTGLGSRVVHTDDYGLLGLDADNAIGSLLSVDATVVRTNGNILRE